MVIQPNLVDTYNPTCRDLMEIPLQCDYVEFMNWIRMQKSLT